MLGGRRQLVLSRTLCSVEDRKRISWCVSMARMQSLGQAEMSGNVWLSWLELQAQGAVVSQTRFFFVVVYFLPIKHVSTAFLFMLLFTTFFFTEVVNNQC